MKKSHPTPPVHEAIPEERAESTAPKIKPEENNSDKVTANGKEGKSPHPATPKSETTQQTAYMAEEAYLRLYADFENYKKRIHQEQQHWNQETKKKIFKELFSFIDAFDLAVTHITPTGDDTGLALLHKKLAEVLKKLGLTIDNTALGDTFDSGAHEAINVVPTTDEAQDGCIAQIVSKGYLLGGTRLRFPQVYVYKKA